MKLANMILALGALTLAACAQSKSSPVSPDLSGVVGTWNAETTRTSLTESSQVKRSFTIREDSVTMTTVCPGQDKPVVVRVTAPAVVSARHINVLRSEELTMPAGSTLCQAKIDKGLLGYEIRDGVLLITPKDREQFVFGQKAKQKSAEGGAELMEFLRKTVTVLGQPEIS